MIADNFNKPKVPKGLPDLPRGEWGEIVSLTQHQGDLWLACQYAVFRYDGEYWHMEFRV